ncbi:selenocysteine-specific translation elongation factor [Microlunatus ginsengisoli]
MQVIATAGHVDHGKTTLVRALTGMEPDRLAEERRRGMTLDLGFAWTTLPGGSVVSFVDVPGHERFVPTMLAGAGPVPAAMLVVAADEGWRAQTVEHVAILDSLDVRHGLVVVTRSDLADPATALAESRRRLAETSLGAGSGTGATVAAVAVSAVTGAGLPELRAALDALVAGLPSPPASDRVRLFVDRCFTIRGAGTVVTGTLAAGRLEVGEEIEIFPGGRRARIRGLQSLGAKLPAVSAVARVAVNLRGVGTDEIGRGGALLSVSAWLRIDQFDARSTSLDPADLPGDLVLHVGSAAVACSVRALGHDTCRVRLSRPLPLQLGDRAVLRDPSRRQATGVVVLDVEPPELRRRGAARRRADELAALPGTPDAGREIARRGATTRRHLVALGALRPGEPLPAGVDEVAGFVLDRSRMPGWTAELERLVDADRAERPLGPGPALETARRSLGLPDAALVAALADDSAGRLEVRHGRIARPGAGPAFSDREQAALERLARRLAANPFDAPEAAELAELGLTRNVIAAAAARGLILRLPGEILLDPAAPERAVEALRALEQPFTLSAARQELHTTRRVAVPLLEHLDAVGRTIRVDGARRRLA